MADHKAPLSPWQIIARDSYADGEFAHVESIEDAKKVGDTLFEFLMIELAPSEDCDSKQEALHRIETAIRQLETVRNEMEASIDLDPQTNFGPSPQ